MPLTCSCDFDDHEFEPGDWYYMGDSGDFVESDIKIECKSCEETININDLCVTFSRFRYPKDEQEAKSKGYYDLEVAMEQEATIKTDNHYICEKCGEIYLNLSSVGFECIAPSENMPKLLKQYQHDYKPPKLTRAIAPGHNEK
jgi:predicted RNA-binding Zn-ribbon protein involved in translation (DUF1610 family)